MGEPELLGVGLRRCLYELYVVYDDRAEWALLGHSLDMAGDLLDRVARLAHDRQALLFAENVEGVPSVQDVSIFSEALKTPVLEDILIGDATATSSRDHNAHHARHEGRGGRIKIEKDEGLSLVQLKEVQEEVVGE